MKKLLTLPLLLLMGGWAMGQIITPIIKANFGVDGELRSNYFYNIVQPGTDDWFRYPGSVGPGDFVIDTTGTASITARYATDPAFRKIPFYRNMKQGSYTLMNNRRVIDAVFIRDYHGDDSTSFGGGNKNGMNPQDWACPVSQSVPDKNEILDMFVHVRRQGPGAKDSLWMFGGLSIENTAGDRYFDFEMYQTNIYYDRPSGQFYGYGPDAGHSSWQFNAKGDITVPGDIIFTAEYSTSALSNVEARIWIDKALLSMTPLDFDWTGSFDGASNGSQFGYAGIKPKTAGTFYTGLTSPAGTWAGPFALIRSDNSVSTTYTANQFMEFSINLSKIGLDPVTLLGANACGMPFRRILVKSRASTSFTAALKDFVGPFDFFLAPRVKLAADFPYVCGTNTGLSIISITNPMPTSIYTWSTPDGNIVSMSPDSTSITVSSTGIYIVTQQLQSNCAAYAADTFRIVNNPAACSVLSGNMVNFSAALNPGNSVDLVWNAADNRGIKEFTAERSTDAIHFSPVISLPPSADASVTNYKTADDISRIESNYVYYRLKTSYNSGGSSVSKTMAVAVSKNKRFSAAVTPNPVKDVLNINIYTASDRTVQLNIYDNVGRLLHTAQQMLVKGHSVFSLNGLDNWQRGLYTVKLISGKDVVTDRLLLVK